MTERTDHATPGDATDVARGGALPEGTRVEPYVVHELVGRGSWATVYRVVHAALGVERAMKVVTVADADAGPRLQAEAGAIARLHHPAIVALHDVGTLADGRPYLVMEWVGGGSLRRRLAAAGPLPWPEAARVALALAEALAHAHAHGVLHRDLKPDNVMFDDAGRPKLTDFGVAGLLTERRRDEAVTQAGYVIGTPEYMAPEQLSGLAHSAATDLYGLGLLLYEMLVGALPAAGTVLELLSLRMSRDLDVPPLPGAPRELHALLERLLRRDERARPASAAAIAGELRALLDDAPRPGRFERSPTTTLAPGDPAAPAPARAAARPPAPRAAGRAVPLALVAVAAGVPLLLLLLLLPLLARGAGAAGGAGDAAALHLLQGVLLIAAGLGGGWLAARVLSRRRSALERDAGQLLLGTKDRAALTRTIALEVDELIARTQAIDARVLGATIVQMVHEYERAKASTDRQAALMNAAQLLEQLMGRLSPWYVRHDRAVAGAVSAVGVVSGLVKIATDVVALGRG